MFTNVVLVFMMFSIYGHVGINNSSNGCSIVVIAEVVVIVLDETLAVTEEAVATVVDEVVKNGS